MKVITTLGLLGGIVLSVISLVLLVLDPGGHFATSFSYILFSLLAGLVTLYVALWAGRKPDGGIDIFSPMFGLLFVVLLGATLRAPYLVAEKDVSAAAAFLLFGYDIPEVASNMPWFFMGVCMIIAGYVVPKYRFSIERYALIRTNRVNAQRLLFWSLAYLAISIVGIYSYMKVNGIHFSADILASSSKKALEFDTGGDSVYGAGYQTFIGQFSKYPFLFLTVALLTRALRPNPVLIALALGLGFTSVVIPVLGNTRSTVAVLGLVILIAINYFGRLRFGLLVVWLTISLSLISILTEVRSENQHLENVKNNMAETFLASGNGLDSYRTALIMNLVPKEADYQHGKTYAGIFALFVPRAVWPTKPNTAIGPWVKAEVFHRPDVRNNGWPPGIIAEGYINFGYVGALLIPFLYGAFLRVLYNTVRPLLGRSLVATLIYASGLYPLCFSGLSNNVALGLVGWLYAIGPLALFAFLVSMRQPIRRGFAHAAPAGISRYPAEARLVR